MKKITAATMVKCGEFVIGKAVEDWIYEKELEKRAAEKVKRERIEAKSVAQKLKLEEAEERKKEKIAQRKKLEQKKKIEAEEKADRQKKQYLERFEKAKRVCQEKKRLTWKVQDYRTVLMAMKVKSDGALPSKLVELSECYDNWKHRKTGDIAMEQTQVSDASFQATDMTFEDTFSCDGAVAEHAQILVLHNENNVEVQGEVISTDSLPAVDARESDISQNSSDDTSGYTTLRSQILL